MVAALVDSSWVAQCPDRRIWCRIADHGVGCVPVDSAIGEVGSEVVAGAGVREVAVFRAPVTAVEEIVASVVCRGVGC